MIPKFLILVLQLKTAGEREIEAWSWLIEHIENYKATMWRKSGMTQMLASVVNLEEALIALEAGTDIIDLKNPAQGALGALLLTVIRDIVMALAGAVPVSATIGDLPMQPDILEKAVKLQQPVWILSKSDFSEMRTLVNV